MRVEMLKTRVPQLPSSFFPVKDFYRLKVLRPGNYGSLLSLPKNGQ